MSRWKAFAIHFGISVALFIVLLSIILLVWYPGVLFQVDGGWEGLRIVMGVDLVLGPLLTLVVFKAGKPGLKFDLSCIATLQAVCMSVGMWIVYDQRPLALILAWDTVYSINQEEFEAYGRELSVLDEIPGSYPKLIYLELPENDVAAEIASIRSEFIGDPLYMQTENYQPLLSSGNDEKRIEELFRREQQVRESAVSEIIDAIADKGCLLSKFLSKQESGYVCFNPSKGTIDQFIPNTYRDGES